MKPLAVALVLIALIWAISTQLLPFLSDQRLIRLKEREQAAAERNVTITFQAPVVERKPQPGGVDL